MLIYNFGKLFSSPCSGNYVKLWRDGKKDRHQKEFSSPCSGNYVKLGGAFAAEDWENKDMFSSPCSGNYVKLEKGGHIERNDFVFVPLFGELCKTRQAQARQAQARQGFRPLVRGTM